jgi:ABC-type lipoprotein export system ATPase subunit
MNATNGTGTPFTNFSGVEQGAAFYRADLHIHSFGVSKDVTDKTMTVEGIIEKAHERDIALIAITDHNAIDSVEAAVAKGAAKQIVVLAGVELSTAEGHLLAYFDPADLGLFSTWFGKLDFSEDDETGDRYLLSPMHEVASSIAAAGGIAIPAHINRKKSGCLHKAPTKSLDALICSAAIAGLEIDGPVEFEFFSFDDNDPGSSVRKGRLRKRLKALGDVEGLRLPKLLFSDAHALDRVGRNRDGVERLTRIKMSNPSFDGFRRALQDPDARIRLEERLPESYPRLIGARMIGGFLDGVDIAFSPNLTCLIGGRGAGKSTALEATRCACLSEAHEREKDDEEETGWPDSVQLIYQDAFHEVHYLERSTGGETLSLTGDDADPMSVAVEGYDQDRIAEIIRGYRTEPGLLSAFLDSFAELDVHVARMRELQAKLADNAAELAPVADAATRKKEAEKRLKEAQAKLKVIEKSKLKKALQWARLLEKERTLRSAVTARLGSLRDDINGIEISVDVEALISGAEITDLAEMPGKDLLVGKDGKPGLVSLVEGLETELDSWKKQGSSSLDAALEEIEPRVAEWDDYETRVKARIAKIADELRDQGVNPNMGELNRLTGEEADAKTAIRTADEDLVIEGRLRTARRDLLKVFKAEQAARYFKRAEATKRLTKLLNDSLKSFRVKISFRQSAEVAEYEAWLRSVMGQRIFRSGRPASFCRQTHPIDLAQMIRKKQTSNIAALKDDAGSAYFGSHADVDEFIATVSVAALDELESIAVSDLPEITLSVKVQGDVRIIPFDNLSFGQKASILLGALLFSEDDHPLIIDQPEDHLDSAFIFETIVTNLRQVKERRQVILATHNANIAVLGDAELIVPLQGYDGRGVTRDVGSVDNSKTSERACAILEGGKSAYLRRGEMYGLIG